MYYYKYKTIVGDIFISVDKNYILEISYTHNNYYLKKETKLSLEAISQIKQYLSGRRKSFDLPLKVRDSKFQKAVYKQLLEIPYGQIQTYKQVATSINNEKASQAVGRACSKNKFIIVIPCHRVISSSGLVGGYVGGIGIKTYLLNLERIQISNNKVMSINK